MPNANGGGRLNLNHHHRSYFLIFSKVNDSQFHHNYPIACSSVSKSFNKSEKGTTWIFCSRLWLDPHHHPIEWVNRIELETSKWCVRLHVRVWTGSVWYRCHICMNVCVYAVRGYISFVARMRDYNHNVAQHITLSSKQSVIWSGVSPWLVYGKRRRRWCWWSAAVVICHTRQASKRMSGEIKAIAA